jgi:hypothetical protein
VPLARPHIHSSHAARNAQMSRQFGTVMKAGILLRARAGPSVVRQGLMVMGGVERGIMNAFISIYINIYWGQWLQMVNEV